MKAITLKLVSLVGVLSLCAGNVSAQESELEQLRKEMHEMRKYMQELERKLEKLEQKPPVAAPPEAKSERPPEIETSDAVAAKSWSPTDPIRVGKGRAYADIGLVATFAAGGSTANDIEGGTQLGGHDPNQRGFTVQGVELNLQGAIDPYLRGNANILFSLDSGGETFVELEEAWLESVSLPGNLQIRAGQILTDFGRVNTQHPHAWAFVDSPLVNARLLGPDGLRNPGARLSWLVPTPFFSELFLSIQNSSGATAESFLKEELFVTNTVTQPGGRPTTLVTRVADPKIRSFEDLLFTTRYAASFDLTDAQTLLAGISAAFGPNETHGPNGTQIFGADFYWKWKSSKAHGGFPFVSWQTEVMLRRYDARSYAIVSVPPGNQILSSYSSEFVDWGFYSQLAWGFRKDWVAALRGDYVAPANRLLEATIPTADLERSERWRISPNLTWYPSEFSKLRLQYNYDDRRDVGVDHSLWLQFEFLLGAHAAHKF